MTSNTVVWLHKARRLL